jgi:hypothetical protein
MKTDGKTLNLIAAVLCGIGSLTALIAADSRSARLSGFFGLIGSFAWAASAYQDVAEAGNELVEA